MIRVTRLNKESLMINSDMIEMIEESPDTVLILTTGRKLIVCESVSEVYERIIAFRRDIYVKLPVVE